MATAAAAAVASISSFSPSRAMTPPLCPRKSLSPCPPERRRSLSSRKEKWVFDTKPPQQQQQHQQQQQQQQVIVKNPPVFARKSRAASVEKQVGSSSDPRVPSPSIVCASKCKQAFSTREAMRLHTCNSILDSQYLTDLRADRQRSPSGTPTSAPSLQEKPKSTRVSKSKSPDLLQNTMQAIELERMGDLQSSRKVFNVIDSLFVETFKDGKDGGRVDNGQMREVSIIAYLPQPESHQIVSQILDGIIDGVTSKPTSNSNSPPKRRPSKRSPSEAFSRSGYVNKKRRMLARRRSAESLIIAANEPRNIASEIVGDLVSDSVSKAEAMRKNGGPRVGLIGTIASLRSCKVSVERVEVTPPKESSVADPTAEKREVSTSPTTKRRTRQAKTGAEAFSRQSYSKRRR